MCFKASLQSYISSKHNSFSFLLLGDFLLSDSPLIERKRDKIFWSTFLIANDFILFSSVWNRTNSGSEHVKHHVFVLFQCFAAEPVKLYAGCTVCILYSYYKSQTRSGPCRLNTRRLQDGYVWAPLSWDGEKWFLGNRSSCRPANRPMCKNLQNVKYLLCRSAVLCVKQTVISRADGDHVVSPTPTTGLKQTTEWKEFVCFSFMCLF